MTDPNFWDFNIIPLIRWLTVVTFDTEWFYRTTVVPNISKAMAL